MNDNTDSLVSIGRKETRENSDVLLVSGRTRLKDTSLVCNVCEWTNKIKDVTTTVSRL